MPDPDLIALFVRPLSQLGVRYMVSGSIAAMLFGEPRFTNDIDLVVFLTPADVPGLSRVFPPSDYYLPPPEVIAVEIARERRGHFNVIHMRSGLKADLYTSNRDELHDWAIGRARTFSLEGSEVTVAPLEYVILRKLEYFREGGSEKHLRDIRTMVSVSGDELDRTALADWLRRMGLEEQWARAQA
ncbi:MAG TPA: hypothetical protein VMS22_14525 [Candidatus Eisenbacteria bacterium]|nr:hypothetical protein [Candidatus Eisenbacteria bacterium]